MKKISGQCFLAFLLSLAAGSSFGETTAPQIPTHFFSLNGITPFHDIVSADPSRRDATFDSMRTRLLKMRELGATSVRVDFWWSLVEPTPGVYNWEFADRVINTIIEAGLEPLPILCYNAADSPGQSPETEEAREAFGEYVYQVVSRYRNNATRWEVWNEPNITPYWLPAPNPQQYGLLLKTAYRRAKQANPDAFMIGMCPANADYEFIEAAYRSGGAGHLDALSFHHYNSTPDETIIEEEIRRIRRLMQRFGDGDKPILITETGLSTGPSGVVATSSPQEQADWIVKRHLICLAEGIDAVYYYKLMDDPPDPTPDGIWGLLDWQGNPKPSMDVYLEMTDNLRGARHHGHVYPILDGRDSFTELEAQLFHTNSGWKLAAWIRKNGPEGVIQLYSNGQITREITLSATPTWLDMTPYEAANLAGFSVTPRILHLPHGGSHTVTLRLAAEGTSIDLSPTVAALNAAGFHLEGDIQPLTGEESTRTWTISSSGHTNSTTSIPIGNPGGPAGILTIMPESAVQGRANLRSATTDSLSIEWEFENRLDRSLDGYIEIGALPPRTKSLLPAETRQVTESYPTASMTWGENRILARFQPDDVHGGEASIGSVVIPIITGETSVDRFRDIVQRQVSMRLSPGNQQHIPGNRPLDANSFGAEIRLAVSDSHLYIQANVLDPTPMQNAFSEGAMWQGDGLELFLGVGGPTHEQLDYTRSEFQIGLSPGDGTLPPFVYNWRPLVGGGGRLVPGAWIESTGIPYGYRIEALIPLKEFEFLPRDGAVIAIDINLSFRASPEDAEREGLLIWNGTPRNFVNPSRWGVGILRQWSQEE